MAVPRRSLDDPSGAAGGSGCRPDPVLDLDLELDLLVDSLRGSDHDSSWALVLSLN